MAKEVIAATVQATMRWVSGSSRAPCLRAFRIFQAIDLWEEAFDDEEGDATNDERQSNGGERFREAESCPVDRESSDGGEEECESDGDEELSVRGSPPIAEGCEAVFEQGEDGENGS